MAYEVMKFMTHDCQRKKVRDGEMAYYENEDVGWQGKEEEHFTCMALNLGLVFVLLFKVYQLAHRPGCSGTRPMPRFSAGLHPHPLFHASSLTPSSFFSRACAEMCAYY